MPLANRILLFYQITPGLRPGLFLCGPLGSRIYAANAAKGICVTQKLVNQPYIKRRASYAAMP